MPPKRVAKPKLHQLAVELPQKTIISDLTTKKQYCVGKQFATGGFGRIYTCNEVGSKTELVVKVEPYDNGPLFTEMNVFIRILKKDQIAQFMRDRSESLS
ncbi:unnamed protein product [Heligmosomoides polygyrus]|uniref:Protein kinase domain-containing protein n=1 Tax=Heligmosomoides polygyrus TaxID=6339 RepID=A0A183GRN9_HELPZ|nr:unnamed protein product [Heligmosomoides polygyrus]